MLDRRGIACALALAVGAVACNPAPSSTPAAVTMGPPSTGPTAAASAPAASFPVVETPIVSVAAGTRACELDELKASHGLVEAAGDGRVTEIVLVSAGLCSVNLFPGLRLRDATGAEVADSASAGPGRLDLVADVAYRSQVLLANWCAPDPGFPLTLALVVADGQIDVTGSSFPEDGELPPCATDGATVLEASAWNPIP
ncbi:MAG: hypothetical protein ABIR64_00995 [Candidatus Limnocylindrales bacterium]